MSRPAKFLAAVIGGASALTGGSYMLAEALINESPAVTSEANAATGAQQAAQPAPPPPQAQVNTMWGIKSGGRMYALWDGYVVEDNENNTGYQPSDNAFDKNIYDFDLGVVIHSTGYVRGVSPGSLTRTLFNELSVNGQMPPHIENVRKIGCELVGIFEKKHASGTYGPPPADVLSFKERHCPAAPAQTPAP
jgi:hypothetical protein